MHIYIHIYICIYSIYTYRIAQSHCWQKKHEILPRTRDLTYLGDLKKKCLFYENDCIHGASDHAIINHIQCISYAVYIIYKDIYKTHTHTHTHTHIMHRIQCLSYTYIRRGDYTYIVYIRTKGGLHVYRIHTYEGGLQVFISDFKVEPKQKKKCR